MGNAGGSLRFRHDEDEEDEEDGGEHLSQVKISGIPIAAEEEDEGITKGAGGHTGECVSGKCTR